MHITDWETHRKKLLENPKIRQALKETRPEYEIARAIILARLKHKLTQKELARRLKTKQSVISRVENGQTTPTISFLKRLASSFGAVLKVRFEGI